MFVCEVAVIGLLHHDDNQLIKSCDWSNGTILVRVTTRLVAFITNIIAAEREKAEGRKEGAVSF